jgi:hypothetical protein
MSYNNMIYNKKNNPQGAVLRQTPKNGCFALFTRPLKAVPAALDCLALGFPLAAGERAGGERA